MVSVCLLSDALLQHLPSYLGFSYLGRGVSLHGCSSKAQPLVLTLDVGYLLTATLPDLQCGIAPLGPHVPAQPRLRVTPLVAAPGLGRGGMGAWGSSSRPPPLTSDAGVQIDKCLETPEKKVPGMAGAEQGPFMELVAVSAEV